MTDKDMRALQKRLVLQRARLLNDHPFFGKLLMRLNLGVASCGTAFTDGERIVFDSDFASRLDDEGMGFVLMHETLHVVLGHLFRGEKLNDYLFNVACDIVVNSLILNAMGLDALRLDGENVMHQAPDGSEGADHTAEEVYDMLLKAGYPSDPDQGLPLVDRHDIWANLSSNLRLKDEWRDLLVKSSMSEGTPRAIRTYVDGLLYHSRQMWRQILRDFIQVVTDDYDYSFMPGDHRFTGRPYVLPSFNPVETEEIRNLWFVVDASGSVSARLLTILVQEIEEAMAQIPKLSGWISFFDTKVSTPRPFSSTEEIGHMRPVGGGGTNFHSIFAYLKNNMEEVPTAVIILTDGLAEFPGEEESMGVPVLWAIAETEVEPPWGIYLKIETA